ncbi:glycoside hydrolase family 4 [Treponema primitia ZAS-2]|uniref:Glycoside hydrolase family 4 n=1 Tax=Treponema primitia (strain ATCC BAA-887 / DSM 12427 / ZAS-2) TaxID=545694 RepID=F5YPI5_TREPZ|nr:glycoside hydrolase [Treponema primitia]AEF84345.1 glycoside hydrolase family 4 [Treponema primitia ZAS-2]
MKKMTVIGGASVRAPFFAYGLAKRAAELGISELCLFDTDREKLDSIGHLAILAAQKANSSLKVVLETDEDRAIRGVDYFVVTIRVGGDHSRVIDEEIARKNGVLGQETTGAGGFFMAARSIPILVRYCDKIRSLAPGAWIFNFTNPSGLVAQALRSLGYDRVIGICDTPSSTKLRIAGAMGYDNENFYMEFFGLNHLSWARKAVYDGRDVLQEILHTPDITRQVGELGMFDPDLLRLIGHVPNEYLYYYYYRDQSMANIKNAETTRGRTVEENNIRMMAALTAADVKGNPEEALRIYLKHMFARESSYMQIETAKKVINAPTELVMPDSEGYAGIAMAFISAMEKKESRYVVLSVPNQGSIRGLGDDDVVEITCKVDGNGPTPVPIGVVGEDIFSIIKAVKAFERLSVQAIIEGSADCAVRALMAHPLIGSYGAAKNLIADFMDRQGVYSGHWR